MTEADDHLLQQRLSAALRAQAAAELGSGLAPHPARADGLGGGTPPPPAPPPAGPPTASQPTAPQPTATPTPTRLPVWAVLTLAVLLGVLTGGLAGLVSAW